MAEAEKVMGSRKRSVLDSDSDVKGDPRKRSKRDHSRISSSVKSARKASSSLVSKNASSSASGKRLKRSQSLQCGASSEFSDHADEESTISGPKADDPTGHSSRPYGAMKLLGGGHSEGLEWQCPGSCEGGLQQDGDYRGRWAATAIDLERSKQSQELGCDAKDARLFVEHVRTLFDF